MIRRYLLLSFFMEELKKEAVCSSRSLVHINKAAMKKEAKL